MEFDVCVTDEFVKDFSTNAKSTLVTEVNKYCNSIVKEANLLGSTSLENGAKAEITSNTVLLAVKRSENSQLHKKSWFLIIIKIIATISLVVVGMLFDANGFEGNVCRFIWFIILLVIACISTVLQFVYEER